MKTTNNRKKTMVIKFPIQELGNYQKGILKMLSKVELHDFDNSAKDDLKSVYKLLDHLRKNDQKN